MDAPKTRYRVIEKQGRLIVIDTATGAPATPDAYAPPRQTGQPASFIELGSEPFERLAAAIANSIVKIAIRERTPEGDAIVDWNWTVNGRNRSWHARLDRDQERALGHALLQFVPLPIAAAGVILPFGSAVTGVSFLALLGAVPLAIFASLTIKGLQRDSADQPPV